MSGVQKAGSCGPSLQDTNSEADMVQHNYIRTHTAMNDKVKCFVEQLLLLQGYSKRAARPTALACGVAIMLKLVQTQRTAWA